MTVLTTGIALGSVPQAFSQDGRQPDAPSGFKAPFQAEQAPVFYFKRETFTPYVGGVFKVSAGARSVSMTLESVRDCTSGAENKLTPESRPTDCFALVFRSAGELTDLTSIYDVEHAALGSFSLFMTRRDGPDKTHFYEAVINHVL